MYRLSDSEPLPVPRTPRQPKYRLHKARNCAVVTIDGRNHYLGSFDSPESHQAYARLIAEWKRTASVLPQTPTDGPAARLLTINELILAFFRYAQTHYVKNAAPTSEQGCLKQALRFVRKLYGTSPAAEFGPRALKNVRQAMIESGRARKSINKDVNRVKRMFRWAVGEELLPAAVYEALRCVSALGVGRTAARETEPVAPVAEEDVQAVLPHLPPPVAAMVELQLLTGARPQEIIHLRPADIRDEGTGSGTTPRPSTRPST
jgi:integrase